MDGDENTNIRLWLASQSERRSEWLADNFRNEAIEIVSLPLIDNSEPEYNSIPVREQVSLVLDSKLRSAFLEIKLGRLEQLFDNNLDDKSKPITIVSDTLVESPDDINVALGKPKDSLIATSMLMLLSGCRHNVWSATGIITSEEIDLDTHPIINKITLGSGYFAYTFVESSTIEISVLDEDILSDLVKSNSWKGKAGAYDLAGKMGRYATLISGKEVCVLGFSSSAMIFLNKLISDKL